MKTISMENPKRKYLYSISTKSICHVDDSWWQEFRKKAVCPGCKDVYPDVRKSGIDIFLERRPDISAVNSIQRADIGIARRDFLDLFADKADRYLSLGRVFKGNGELLNNFVSFVGQRLLPLRGSEKSQFFGNCHRCGRFNYVPEHPWYVLRDSLFDQPIFQSWGLDGLIVNEELQARIKRGRWKGICIAKIPIVDEAIDGIKEIPADLVV